MEKNSCPFVPNFLLGCAGGIQYLSLKKASRNPRKSQEKTLRAILTYARDTEYGKEHHFAEILEAPTDTELFVRYQKYVQLNDYEDIRPYVEKHKNGGENILFPGKPLMYATTSGTTNEPKWVPITKEYLNNIYGKMTKVWLFNFIKNRPKVFTGKIVSIVGKVKEGEAPDGTMFGSVSGVTQRDCPKFVKKLYASPASVFAIEDYTARYYTIMRMGIERNVTLVVTANPSTIVEMQNNVNEYFEDYCNDIVLDDTLNTVLFPHFHYYEFVAEDELESENKHFLQLWELEKGKRYCPYVTTFAGLYRYNMNDLVEVGDSFCNTPTVHMIQKVNGIVTMTGEKLHERQFIEAVHEAEKQTGMQTKFFIGFADMDLSAYHFYYEFADLQTSQEQAEQFTHIVDKVLKDINIEYAAKRASFRVKDPLTHRLVGQSFEKFKAECIAEGARDGQFKLNLLLQDEKRHAKFKKLVLE